MPIVVSQTTPSFLLRNFAAGGDANPTPVFLTDSGEELINALRQSSDSGEDNALAAVLAAAVGGVDGENEIEEMIAGLLQQFEDSANAVLAWFGSMIDGLSDVVASDPAPPEQNAPNPQPDGSRQPDIPEQMSRSPEKEENPWLTAASSKQPPANAMPAGETQQADKVEPPFCKRMGQFCWLSLSGLVASLWFGRRYAKPRKHGKQ